MRHRSSKSGLFLMELMGVILIFSIASVVCVQLFVRSSIISRNSKATNGALTQVHNIEACLFSSEGDLEMTAQLIEGNRINETIVSYYDTDWQIVTSQDMARYECVVYEGEDEIYEIKCRDMENMKVLLSHSLTVHMPLERSLP